MREFGDVVEETHTSSLELINVFSVNFDTKPTSSGQLIMVAFIRSNPRRSSQTFTVETRTGVFTTQRSKRISASCLQGKHNRTEQRQVDMPRSVSLHNTLSTVLQTLSYTVFDLSDSHKARITCQKTMKLISLPSLLILLVALIVGRQISSRPQKWHEGKEWEALLSFTMTLPKSNTNIVIHGSFQRNLVTLKCLRAARLRILRSFCFMAFRPIHSCLEIG